MDIRGRLVRLHDPLSLRLWDRVVFAAGAVFFALAAVLLIVFDQREAAAVSGLGGLVLTWQSRTQRRRYWERVWALAAEDGHPIEVLAMYEYLDRLRFRDLVALDAWFARCDDLALPYDDTDAPEPALALLRLLGTTPV